MGDEQRTDEKESRCPYLSSEDIRWIKMHVEEANVWRERRKKIFDAVSVWAVIGTLTVVIGILSGSARWILEALLKVIP